jgi:hypothetical protein
MISARTARRLAVALTVGLVSVGALLAREGPARNRLEIHLDHSESGVDFSPDGKFLIHGLEIWDLATGKRVARGDDGRSPCTQSALSPDGRYLAAIHRTGGTPIRGSYALCLWDNTAGPKLRLAATLDQCEHGGLSLAYLPFSPDGRMLLTRYWWDNKAVVWEVASRTERLRLDPGGTILGFGPDGRTVISARRDGLVQRWDLATRKPIATDDRTERKDFLYVDRASISADTRTVAISDGHSVLIKDTQTNKTLRRFDDLDWASAALSQDGKTANVGGRLFDVGTGKQLTGRGDGRTGLFAPDGKSVLVHGQGTVALLGVDTLPRTDKSEAAPKQPASPVEATLVSRKPTYTLDLGGFTAQDFARQVGGNPQPPGPAVDLVLTIRNVSDHKVQIHPPTNDRYSLYLIGKGAINYPWQVVSTDISKASIRAMSKVVTLAPGETFSTPVTSLEGNDRQRSYWLLPGEYTLYLRCSLSINPDPNPTEKTKALDGWGAAHPPIAPLRFKVVAAGKK